MSTTPARRRLLPPAFYRRPATVVAPELLNKVVVVCDADGGRRAGRIVEVEAYAGRVDPASHAYRGETPRNRTMFGPAGRLYVYFTYGMHWCSNIVCASPGVADAVLLRALVPLDGVDDMRVARQWWGTSHLLCRGPGRLSRALGIDGTDDGTDLRRGRIRVVDDGTSPPSSTACGPRVGVSVATEVPWRYWVPGDRHVSTYRPGRPPRAARVPRA